MHKTDEELGLVLSKLQ